MNKTSLIIHNMMSSDSYHSQVGMQFHAPYNELIRWFTCSVCFPSTMYMHVYCFYS